MICSSAGTGQEITILVEMQSFRSRSQQKHSELYLFLGIYLAVFMNSLYPMEQMQPNDFIFLVSQIKINPVVVY